MKVKVILSRIDSMRQRSWERTLCVMKPTSNSEVQKVAKKETQNRKTEASSWKAFFVSENLSFIWRAMGRSEAKIKQRGRYWRYGRREWMTECGDEDGKEWESRAQMEGLPLQEILPLLDFLLLQKIYLKSNFSVFCGYKTYSPPLLFPAFVLARPAQSANCTLA